MTQSERISKYGTQTRMLNRQEDTCGGMPSFKHCYRNYNGTTAIDPKFRNIIEEND